ncbi:MAG: hypothetical protein QM749_03650 [Aquabacterium sp.]
MAELQAVVMDLLADENRSRAATEDTMRKRIKDASNSEAERARLEAQLLRPPRSRAANTD